MGKENKKCWMRNYQGSRLADVVRQGFHKKLMNADLLKIKISQQEYSLDGQTNGGGTKVFFYLPKLDFMVYSDNGLLKVAENYTHKTIRDVIKGKSNLWLDSRGVPSPVGADFEFTILDLKEQKNHYLFTDLAFSRGTNLHLDNLLIDASLLAENI